MSVGRQQGGPGSGPSASELLIGDGDLSDWILLEARAGSCDQPGKGAVVPREECEVVLASPTHKGVLLFQSVHVYDVDDAGLAAADLLHALLHVEASQLVGVRWVAPDAALQRPFLDEVHRVQLDLRSGGLSFGDYVFMRSGGTCGLVGVVTRGEVRQDLLCSFFAVAAARLVRWGKRQIVAR